MLYSIFGCRKQPTENKEKPNDKTCSFEVENVRQYHSIGGYDLQYVVVERNPLMFAIYVMT